MPNLKRVFFLKVQPWTWKVKTVIWTCEKLSLGEVKKLLSSLLGADVELKGTLVFCNCLFFFFRILWRILFFQRPNLLLKPGTAVVRLAR